MSLDPASRDHARGFLDLGKGRGLPPRGALLHLSADELTETLPEARGEQVVDDGVDGGAEVEHDAGQDVDALVDAVQEVGPPADGTPEEALDVEGSPAEAEHNHDHRCRAREGGEEGKGGGKEGEEDAGKEGMMGVGVIEGIIRKIIQLKEG